jgi:hypothetical protein
MLYTMRYMEVMNRKVGGDLVASEIIDDYK